MIASNKASIRMVADNNERKASDELSHLDYVPQKSAKPELLIEA